MISVIGNHDHLQTSTSSRLRGSFRCKTTSPPSRNNGVNLECTLNLNPSYTAILGKVWGRPHAHHTLDFSVDVLASCGKGP